MYSKFIFQGGHLQKPWVSPLCDESYTNKFGSAPVVAFQALVLKAQVPTKENVMSGKGSFSKGLCYNLVPTDSFLLPNCTLLYSMKKYSTAFRIEEILYSQLRCSKYVCKTTSLKITLRTVTKGQSEDVVATLKAQNSRWIIAYYLIGWQISSWNNYELCNLKCVENSCVARYRRQNSLLL